MNYFKAIAAVAVLGVLTSCTTRNTQFEGAVNSSVSSTWYVHQVEVSVPDTLSTTEINVLQPDVDIVWHGDLPGDRRKQVQTILEDSISAAAETLVSENLHRGVVIQVELLKFHSLTPRARALVGGVHKISFMIQVVDEKTGEVLAGPSIIEADEFAYGGWRAVQSDAENEGMKVRISNRITEVVANWLGLISVSNALEESRIISIGR